MLISVFVSLSISVDHCSILFFCSAILCRRTWSDCKKMEEHISLHLFAFSRRFYPKRLTVHSGYTFVLSVFVFPGNRTHNLCAANAILYHWATGTLVASWLLLVNGKGSHLVDDQNYFASICTAYYIIIILPIWCTLSKMITDKYAAVQRQYSPLVLNRCWCDKHVCDRLLPSCGEVVSDQGSGLAGNHAPVKLSFTFRLWLIYVLRNRKVHFKLLFRGKTWENFWYIIGTMDKLYPKCNDDPLFIELK